MNAKFTLSPRLARIYSAVFIVAGLVSIILPVIGLKSAVFSFAGGIAVAVMYIIVMPIVAYFASLHPRYTYVYIALLNITSFFAFIFYIGVYTPFILLWAVILVLSYLYSGILAFILSSILLLMQTAIMLFVYNDYADGLADSNAIYIGLSFISGLGTIITGFFTSMMIMRAKVRSERLVESQQAEQVQLNRLNTLLNSISDTVLTVNRYGRITSQNSAALSFFDTNQTLVGKSIDTVLELKDDAMQIVSVRKLAADIKGTIVRDDVSIVDSSDAIMRLNVQISPIHGKFGDDDSGSVIIIRDITRQKTLEDEKDEFISVTSHELRTPIAIAEGSLSNLLYMFEKGVETEKLASSAVAAHDQVLYLARMINDLSTLSRAERGVGDAAEVINMNTMLQDLYHRYQPEAEAKSLALNLDLDGLPDVLVSRLYLEEILQNFLTNAIKYTKEGSVTLSGKIKDGRIVCSVTDTGIGISKTDQDKIFNKFFRSEDYRTRETSGTGLGLYVVTKLASKLNTKVDVVSRLNHGSTFSFTLPSSVLIPDNKTTDEIS